MAIREAAIRINMKAQGFLSGLRKLVQETDLVSKKMQRQFKVVVGRSFQAGVKEAKKSLEELSKGAKENMKNAATLGGAIGTGAMVNNALQLQEVYGQVANQLERSTGKAHNLAEVQGYVVSAAKKTKRTHEELGNAMAIALDRGADPTFVVQSLETIGHVMNATGKESEKVGRLLAGMSIKYGLNGAQAAAMMDEVLAAQSAGKLSMEEYMEDFNEFGSIAKTAGLSGTKGLQFMLGMITKMGPALNGSTGEVSAGLDVLFERLRDVGIVENIFKTAAPGVKFDKKQFSALDNAVDQLEFMAKGGPKVMAAFKESFTGREETAAIEAMMGSYYKTYNEQISKGVDKTQAHLDAMKDLRIDFADMTKPVGESGKIIEQSNRAQQSGAAKVRDAMNILNEAMTKPEMLDALDNLSKNLPSLASGFAKVIALVVKHPLLAAGGYGALKIGASFAGGAMEEAGSRIGKIAMKSFKADIKDMGGPWKAAGAALGIAAVAVIAYEGGKALVDAMYKGIGEAQNKTVASEAGASAVAGGTDMGAKEASLQSIRQQIAQAKEAQSGIGGMAEGAANAMFGALAGLGASLGLNDEVKYTDTRADNLAMLEAAERELVGSIDRQKKSTQGVATGSDQAAKALNDAATAANNVAKAFDKIGGGIPRPQNTGPGYAFTD